MPTIQEWLNSPELRIGAEVFLKLLIGAILGGIIGWEREVHGRPAGMRTHMLVVLGVVMFSEVSKAFGGEDDSRIAAQIVTGIGFLGAGTILRTAGEIRGLTTAASIWSAAAIGMAVSVGGPFYVVAVGGALLALFTLAIVERFERAIARQERAREVTVGVESRTSVFHVLRALDEAGGSVKSVNVDEAASGFEVRMSVIGERTRLTEAMSDAEGVVSVTWADLERK